MGAQPVAELMWAGPTFLYLNLIFCIEAGEKQLLSWAARRTQPGAFAAVSSCPPFRPSPDGCSQALKKW